MLEYPESKDYIIIDTIFSEWFNSFKALVEEHFPKRDKYWSVLNLFYIAGNGSYAVIDEDLIMESESTDQEILDQVLAGEYELTRENECIELVLWCLITKGVMALPEKPLLFLISW